MHALPPSPATSIDTFLEHIPDSFLTQSNVTAHQYTRNYEQPEINLHRFKRGATCQSIVSPLMSSTLSVLCASLRITISGVLCITPRQ